MEHNSTFPIKQNELDMLRDEATGYLKSVQWEQSNKAKSRDKETKDEFRKKILEGDFVFIEDTTHGRIQDDISPYEVFSEEGWNKHKLWIYHPEGSIKRSYHLDGRQGTRKYTSDDLTWGYSE